VEQFDLTDLQRPGFHPATSIGRYLISDEIQLDRSGRGAAKTVTSEDLINV
jgi:D-methionine transport system ATP-binding protein